MFLTWRSKSNSLPSCENPPWRPTKQEIAERAKFRWEEKGSPEGQDTENWQEAEQELQDEYSFKAFLVQRGVLSPLILGLLAMLAPLFLQPFFSSNQILLRQGSKSRRTGLLTRPNGSGEPSYVIHFVAGVIPEVTKLKCPNSDVGIAAEESGFRWLFESTTVLVAVVAIITISLSGLTIWKFPASWKKRERGGLSSGQYPSSRRLT